ncbi:MAG TPA: polysaccharide biosynthesis/export family protein [Sphingomicrobium sp.]|nr:polysaccharide biosynthesis/export family protein [Sphingomicrobium sp.]
MRRVGYSGVGRSALLMILTAAVGGCAETRGGNIPYNVNTFGAPDPPTVAALDASYKIAPMDTLAIRVFGMEDITGDYQVDLRGNVSLPLIGEVTAMNLTPTQLDALLSRKYGEKYLENPDISVGIKESAGRNVTVDGAVNKGGIYPIAGSVTLMQAIALAGGVDNETANPRRVAVFRTINGQRQAAAFDLVSIRRGEMPDPPVYSGDIIVVDGSAIKEAQKKIFQAFPLLNVFRPF